ncbi:hypothetical protein BJP36_43660 [Moorena producens JHB]|uniref:Uncharacterized protein n=1 Tax=Moorena producens (strain JHB) TaxID=1454205 RepID=A0A9Q9UVW4_MOOP1|nr:hypothetical protein [Moorena producens]WAN69260.1 hypothetical protein BJP36_43660 [Moorena producens JHB]
MVGLPTLGQISVEWASCVELASSQFQYIFGRAGCPLYSDSIDGRAGRMPTLLRFNRWLGGQDAHSTPIQ